MASISLRTPTAGRTHRKTLERLLERQQATLEAHREGLRRSGRSEISEVRDSEEHTVDDVRAGVNVAMLELDSQAAWGIEAALWRLNAGTFGRCSDCRTMIPARRLAALSFAERCRACQDACDLAAGPGH
jgi:DnaK suppressor protein